jgi:intracellular sulfur oxidation DsrE/DsrF family protein
LPQVGGGVRERFALAAVRERDEGAPRRERPDAVRVVMPHRGRVPRSPPCRTGRHDGQPAVYHGGRIRLLCPGASCAGRLTPHGSKERLMKGKHRIVGLSLAGALLLGNASLAVAADTQASASAPARNRLVLQVSDADPKKWGLALNNARNVQADLGKENVEIEIVAYGPGIGMLKKDSEVGPRVADARAAGMTVVACENTMRGQQLKHEDMLPTIGYVPAGVVEIMQKQQQGWAYIRP